jgi:hypothetical protein
MNHHIPLTTEDILYRAKVFNLPADWPHWGTCDVSGTPAATVALRSGTLPEDFTKWHVHNKFGWSVAHEAALLNKLPYHFNDWEIVDNFGVSVSAVFLEDIDAPTNFFDKWWTPLCSGHIVIEVLLDKMPRMISRINVINTMECTEIGESVLKTADENLYSEMMINKLFFNFNV